MGLAFSPRLGVFVFLSRIPGPLAQAGMKRAFGALDIVWGMRRRWF